jgi:hypothetical protein
MSNEKELRTIKLPEDPKIGDTFWTLKDDHWTYIEIPKGTNLEISNIKVFESLVLDYASHVQLIYTGKQKWICGMLIGKYYVSRFEITETPKSNLLKRLFTKIENLFLKKS